MIRPGTPIPARGRRPDRKSGASTVASAPAAATEVASVPANAIEFVAPAVVAEKPADAETEVANPAARSRAAVKRPHHQKQSDHKAPPLSSAALTGQEPLRTFGQLKQFWNKKSQ